jgi:Beta-ketoacyl synthase, N-terminal domain
MRVYVDGIGLLAPGLNGWLASIPILSGAAVYETAPLVIPPPNLLPPAERRRTPAVVKLALTVAGEALANAGRSATDIATVFTSSGGDGDVIHQICEALTEPGREVSPTRFHNSVHNAPAGYWGIATGCHEPSTSLCAYDASFTAGLIEAASQVHVERRSVMLIAYDAPYPEPLNGARHISAGCGIAMLLSPEHTNASLSAMIVSVTPNAAAIATMPQPELEAMRAGVPAARGLPLLAAIAARRGGTLSIPYLGDSAAEAAMEPC